MVVGAAGAGRQEAAGREAHAVGIPIFVGARDPLLLLLLPLSARRGAYKSVRSAASDSTTPILPSGSEEIDQGPEAVFEEKGASQERRL